ncbi:MAG: ATP-dependent Clp protease proteolytic subunit [Pirellulaceae bacterium]
MLRNRETLNEILAQHSGKTADQVKKDMDRDLFLTAEAAKEYGLVDEITKKQDQEDADA